MPIEEAYQQALLTGGIPALFAEAGNAFRIKLLYNGIELTGNGYGNLAITSIDEEPIIGDDGSVTLKLLSSEAMTAINNDLVWNQLELWDAALDYAVLPRFNSSGTILRNESKKISILVNLTDINNPETPVQQPEQGFYDFTVNNQLSYVDNVKLGLDVPAAYPYAVTTSGTYGGSHPLAGQSFAPGDIYSQYLFFKAASTKSYSSLDWEPWSFDSYSTGTVSITNGVVNLSGGIFPTYVFNLGIAGRFYVNNQIYGVAVRNGNTQLTLHDTSVNAPAGTSYKFASWDFRETDPKFAYPGEMEEALNEFAKALNITRPLAIRNRARVGFYELIVHIHRRILDIIDDFNTGSYATWQSQVATAANYVTDYGFTLADWLRETGGVVTWACYVTDGFNDPGQHARFNTRTERIAETLIDLNIPNCPLFMNYTLEGFGTFLSTNTGNKVDEDLQQQLIETVHALQPWQWGFWGALSNSGENQYQSGDLAFITSVVNSLL